MIVKCSHCRKILSYEDFDSHKCEIELTGTEAIPVIDFLDVSYDDKKLMNGQGIDGILYTFKVVPREPIPIVMTSDEFLQRKKSDNNFTEPGLASEKADISEKSEPSHLKGLIDNT